MLHKIEVVYREEIENIDLIAKLNTIIQSKYQDLFLAVIAHGSVGVNEIIPFSDFDGLIIIKDKYLQTKEFEKFKKETLKLIYKNDPLQHHGWFIISESQLNNYPQSYFPIELFEYVSLIYPRKNLKLNLTIKSEIDFSKAFNNLSSSIKKKIERNFQAKNTYQLKSYLSEIMLLPAFFLEAKLKKGIFKKESFTKVEEYIDKKYLSPIEIASACRANWRHQKLNWIQKIIMIQPARFFRKITQKFIAPILNKELKSIFNIDYNKKLLLLIEEMEHQIKSSEKHKIN